MTGSVRTLLAVEVFRMTGKQLYNLRNKYYNQTHFYNEIVPEFCLTDKGYVKDSEYLPWFKEDDKEKYILFNAYTADKLLESEIQNVGLPDLFEDQDLREFFKKIPGTSYEDFYARLKPANYLVVDVEYWGSGEDFESCATVIGYMSQDLEFKKIENNEEIHQ